MLSRLNSVGFGVASRIQNVACYGRPCQGAAMLAMDRSIEGLRIAILSMSCRLKPKPGFGKDRSRNGFHRLLATLTAERFSRPGWLFEPKWDGERCLAFRRGRKLNLFSRNRISAKREIP